MKNILVSFFLLSIMGINAQNVLNAKSPDDLRKLRANNQKVTAAGDTVQALNDPLPYGFIEDKDILWSKVTWEVIDLNEKLNQIYFHSSDGLISSNLSLFEAIVNGIESGKISQVYDDEYFKVRLSPEEAIGRLSDVRVDEDGLLDRLNGGEEITDDIRKEYTDVQKVRSNKVEMMMIKGMWYIDKRLGEMKYRLLGLSMLGPDAKTVGRGIEGGDELLPLFWIWFENARPTLAKYVVFNPKNNSSKITYDDLLNARRFSSIIYKSENGLGSGNIDEYLPKDAAAQIEESQAIKNSILQHENQMWNY